MHIKFLNIIVIFTLVCFISYTRKQVKQEKAGIIFLLQTGKLFVLRSRSFGIFTERRVISDVCARMFFFVTCSVFSRQKRRAVYTHVSPFT